MNPISLFKSQAALRRLVPSAGAAPVRNLAAVSLSTADLVILDQWSPPELRRNTGFHDQRQQRDFVWHAGFLEQAQVREIETAILSQRSELMQLIQQLPSSTAADSVESDSSSVVPSRSCQIMEQILQQERRILQLCQEYQRLTGEDYEALPQPHCDESATVLKMA